MMHESQVTGWRSNWLVRNVLVEIPIAGGIFSANTVSGMLFYAGKSTAMIAGGTFGMMFNVVAAPKETDDMNLAWTKMTANMAAGSALVTMTYNMSVEFVSYTYQCCKRGTFFSSRKNTEEQNVEMQAQNNSDSDSENTGPDFKTLDEDVPEGNSYQKLISTI